MTGDSNATGRQTGSDAAIADQTIMDNIMLPIYFESDSPAGKAALETMLRVFLDDPDLIVEQYHPEHVVSNTGHRGIRIDVLALDGRGRLIALEIQKDIAKPILHRAVFEAGTLVAHSLLPGETYDKLAKVFVIFVMDKDKFGRRAPLYGTETLFTDGGREMVGIAPTYIFANGEYKSLRTGSTKISRQHSDGSCTTFWSLIRTEW